MTNFLGWRHDLTTVDHIFFQRRKVPSVENTFTLQQCPHCGQRMLHRHGAYLPPQAALIFDMIEASKTRGVRSEILASVFFPGKTALAGRRLVYSHVFRINAFLKSAPVHIVIRPAPLDNGNFSQRGRPPGTYLVKRRRGAAGHMRGAA